jgi:predicted nucleic acid-binding protein
VRIVVDTNVIVSAFLWGDLLSLGNHYNYNIPIVNAVAALRIIATP